MPKVKWGIRFSEDHLRKLDKYKEKTGIAKTDITRQAIQEFFERHEVE